MCRLISGIEGRTSIHAISQLRCQLSTSNGVENRGNASGVADNLGSSSVEDRCRVSYYGFSVHRNATERRLPSGLTKRKYQQL